MVTTDEAVEVSVIAARLSELGEVAALNYFWLMMRNGAPHMTVLAWMSKVVIQRPPEWDRAAIRKEHELGLGSLGSKASKTECYGCQATDRNLYFHHIIEVQNGGSNHARNTVPLCFQCHKILHPWLTVEPKPTRGGGFRSIGSIMGEMFERMRMRK